jgi:signal transduction histidine kinase
VQSGERFQIATEWNETVSSVVNASAIERVIENLILNAFEAMPEGGKLLIKTSQVGERAIISVKDSGKGMTPEFIKERLFHAFATTKQKGIGLGLFSCRDIIEQHGGTIEVESQLNVGTEFRIVLPAEEKLSRPAGQS